jgi:hypothetical protein
MTHTIGFRPAAFGVAFAMLFALSARAAGPEKAPAQAAARKPPAPKAAARDSQAGSAPRAPRAIGKPPAPLKRLHYSARDGFALRMISEQEVSAEIRNGAGRTLAFTTRTLQAGDWTLRPRNLAPGLYTVLLRTGPNLRALRLKIEDAERPGGMPEWVVEKSADSSRSPAVLPRGARLSPAPDERVAMPAGSPLPE